MSIPRFFIKPECINEPKGLVICQDAKLIKQIHKVLRLENGAKIDFLNGTGKIYHCILKKLFVRLGNERLEAHIENIESHSSTEGSKTDIALPLIKINRFEWALEKLTELGINSITPIAFERSIIKLSQEKPAESKAKFTRWQKIMLEASEQCERFSPPELQAPSSFKNWLENLSTGDRQLRLICTERQNVQPLEKLLYNQKGRAASYAIAIGAEGGFTEEEIKLALEYEFIPVSLGKLILRSETAAVYTLAIVNAFLELIQKDPTL